MQTPRACRTIVLATANPHKVRELREIFARQGGGVTIVSLEEAARGRGLVEPAETGRTFEENAAIKARAYAAQTGMVCLADDSGLEVDALGGGPGVISSHYASDGREMGLSREERDAANNVRLLRELEGVAPERRTARFVCVMCMNAPDGGIIATARGAFEGRIGVPPRVPAGENGFGYDPLFLVAPEFDTTSAELSASDKNRLSHRARAASQMAGLIGRLEV